MDDLFEVDDIMDETILGYLLENGSPTDMDIMILAEKCGCDPKDMREQMYAYAAKFAMFLMNGRANEEKITEFDVDPKELEVGIEIEYEHTSDKETAKRIALDHLAELPDYYTRLVKMEKEAGIL